MRDEGTDAEIIAASLADPAEFEVIFRRHYQVVRAYLQRRAGLDVGEELAAQTFLVAFDQRRRFNASYASARPWLFAVATNLLRHHLRDSTRHRRLTSVDASGERNDMEDADERVAAAQLRPVLERALASLSATDRETFLLQTLGDLSNNEIAEALSIPAGTVRSRMHRARNALREQLEALGAIWGEPPEDDSKDD